MPIRNRTTKERVARPERAAAATGTAAKREKKDEKNSTKSRLGAGPGGRPTRSHATGGGPHRGSSTSKDRGEGRSGSSKGS
ncbi:MAG: hypothetical protein ACR2L2_06815 [Acidobacteriota bacterium]